MSTTIKLSELIDELLRISNQSKSIPMSATVGELLDLVHLDEYKTLRIQSIPDEIFRKLP